MYAEPAPTTHIPSQSALSATSSPTGATSGWESERDEAFFRLTATLFPPAFTSGAGVLLASYDEE